jgi:hypothetical protein
VGSLTVSLAELTADQLKEIVDSSDFQAFFDKTSRLVERALHQPYDPLVDYGAVDDSDAYVYIYSWLFLIFKTFLVS